MLSNDTDRALPALEKTSVLMISEVLELQYNLASFLPSDEQGLPLSAIFGCVYCFRLFVEFGYLRSDALDFERERGSRAGECCQR